MVPLADTVLVLVDDNDTVTEHDAVVVVDAVELATRELDVVPLMESV